MGYYIGMDIGGTFARIRVVMDDGTLLGERKVDGCTFNTSGFEKARTVYQQAVQVALAEWNLTVEECLGFCAAVSGVDTRQQAADCKWIFVEMGFEEEVVWVYNDCEIILELTDRPAVVLVAGTGSIAFGKNSRGERVRCGGWGHILSDEGSGMDMGKRVLRAVGDHMDGRKACPALYRLFEEKSAIRSVDELDDYVNRCIMDKPSISVQGTIRSKTSRLRTCFVTFALCTSSTHRSSALQGHNLNHFSTLRPQVERISLFSRQTIEAYWTYADGG